MSESSASPPYTLSKLIHPILEIRERALFNVISKLENQLIDEKDVYQLEDILCKLLEWFQFPQCTNADTVLTLIAQILKGASGAEIIKHLGIKTLQEKMLKVQQTIQPDCTLLVNDVLSYLKEFECFCSDVPPLESDFPLSYRTGDSNFVKERTSPLTPLDHFFTCEPCIDNKLSYNVSDTRLRKKLGNEYSEHKSGKSICNNLPTIGEECTDYSLFNFTWQTLVASDKHVILSAENSLRDVREPLALLNFCQFFTDVLLLDFPPEIFLQKPNIIFSIQTYLTTTNSSRIAIGIIECFLTLTKSIVARIKFYRDPSTLCSKETNCECYPSNELSHSQRLYIYGLNKEKIYYCEKDVNDEEFAKSKQLTPTNYCLSVMQCILQYINAKMEHTKSKGALNKCVILLNDLVLLLSMCTQRQMWNKLNSPTVIEVVEGLNGILLNYTEILDKLRLQAITCGCEHTNRVIQLQLLCNFGFLLTKLIPLTVVDYNLPMAVINTLANCLLDSIFSNQFRTTHETFLQYSEKYGTNQEADLIIKYKEVKRVCKSITAAVKLLKSDDNLDPCTIIELTEQSLPSLEFHGNFRLILCFLEACSEVAAISSNGKTLSTIQDVVLTLLAHGNDDIKKEMYKRLHDVVISAAGPSLNTAGQGAPGSRIYFFLFPEVIMELLLYGVTNDDNEIQEYANNILTLVLKCNILVPNDVWNRVVEALMPNFPLFACHANNNSNLGRAIIQILDPDMAAAFHIPAIEIMKGNASLLFATDSYAREEAVSRLIWLLTVDNNFEQMLPHMRGLDSNVLQNLSTAKSTIDLNNCFCNADFYAGSNLEQVIKLIATDKIEAVVRRSALTQLSVILENPRHHAVFLDNDGVEIVLNVIKSGLTENDDGNYPDVVIPAISVLKNLCIFNPSVRHTLSFDANIYHYLLRSTFLYSTEESLQRDVKILLFFLLFKTFIAGTPSKNNLSIPFLLSEKLQVPFNSNVHWKSSRNTVPSFATMLMADRSCLSSIQIHWNLEWFDGLNSLLEWETVDYSIYNDFNFNETVHLRRTDLIALKVSSIQYCMEKCLISIQNSTSYTDVFYNIGNLESYINLYAMAEDGMKSKHFLSLQWEKTFLPYLKMFPSTAHDTSLLMSVLQILIALLAFYPEEETCWIVSMLKDFKHHSAVRNLLETDSYGKAELKPLHHRLLSLISLATAKSNRTKVIRESQELDASWHHVVKSLIDGLKFSDMQHLYNLAHLNSLLSCLTHLTAPRGWSSLKSNSIPKEPLPSVIATLCELVGAFHSGKGTVATSSFMGINITRQILIVLNNILSEMHYLHLKNWIKCFTDDEVAQKNVIFCFCSLWLSRDVYTRAGVFQFLSGLAVSSNAIVDLIQEMGDTDAECGIWTTLFQTILDNNEACIVRENATNLLVNLTSHPMDNIRIKTHRKKEHTFSNEIIDLLRKHSFFQQLVSILNDFSACDHVMQRLTVNDDRAYLCKCKCGDNYYDKSTATTSISSPITTNQSKEAQQRAHAFITPNFVRMLSAFSINLINIANDVIVQHMGEHNLVQIFLNCILLPQVEIIRCEDQYRYADILEMNTTICSLLGDLIGKDAKCCAYLIHSQNALNTLFLLFNGSIYYTTLPHLIRLRNKVWTRLFTLVEAILDAAFNRPRNLIDGEVHTSIMMAIGHCGPHIFIQTLCEALNANNDYPLQLAVLNFLCAMFRNENTFAKDTKNTMQQLLDNTKIPSTPLSSEENEVNDECVSAACAETNALKCLYMNNLDVPSRIIKSATSLTSTEDSLSGAEICNLLLHLHNRTLIKTTQAKEANMKRAIIVKTLTGLLSVSNEGKRVALERGVLDIVLQELKEFTLKLSLESFDYMRNRCRKGRVLTLLNQIDDLLGLTMNFMCGDECVKKSAALSGFSDLMHKLWVWFLLEMPLLITALKMLCTFTTDCDVACQSLTLTSSTIGAGPRKSPTNFSVLHEIIALIGKEMDLVSQAHDPSILKLCFHILHNCCAVFECRNIIAKSNLLHHMLRLHPSLTKRQKQWTNVELIWLELLLTYTSYADGQLYVAKYSDVFEIIMMLAFGAKSTNRKAVVGILRNVAFNPSNRVKLLNSDEFLNILHAKLTAGTNKEKIAIASIMWALCANHQRGKLVLKCLGLDVALGEYLKYLNVTPEIEIEEKDLNMMRYVRTMLDE